jgi:hypothetical protein
MFNSTVLDVAVGLIFTFLALSLAVSSTVEAIASYLDLRTKTLLLGVKDLLNDPNFQGLAAALYNHALVNPREAGTLPVPMQPTNAANPAAVQPAPAAGASSAPAAQADSTTKKPAYINPKQFASAMIDIIGLAGRAPEAMKQAIDNNPLLANDLQLKALLNGMIDRTSGDLHKVQTELAGWFDNAMDRVSGSYKRRTQLWSFFIALGMAAVLNVSAINIGQTLWVRPMVTKAVTDFKIDLGAKDNVAGELKDLNKLGIPVGWTSDDFDRLLPRHKGYYPGQPAFGVCFNLLAGWLITAVATLFGAPFWFDALQQIIRLKGAGPSPAEKQSDTAAAN